MHSIDHLPDIKDIQSIRSYSTSDRLVQSSSSRNGLAERTRADLSAASSTFIENKQFLSELQEQLEFYKRKSEQKEQLINDLTSQSGAIINTASREQMDSTRKEQEESLATDVLRLATSAAAARSVWAADEVAAARGEVAALRLKVDNLTSQLRVCEQRSEDTMRDSHALRGRLDEAAENEARLLETISSLRQRLAQLETDAQQQQVRFDQLRISEQQSFTTMQQENIQLSSQLGDLDSRLQSLICEKEEFEGKHREMHGLYTELMEQLCRTLGLAGEHRTSKDVINKVMELEREHRSLRGKEGTTSEQLRDCELELKASRETISRLAAEMADEQRHVQRLTQRLEEAEDAKDKATESREGLRRELQLLNERLVCSQRAYTALAESANNYEAQLTQLGSDLSAKHEGAQSAQQTLATLRRELVLLLQRHDAGCRDAPLPDEALVARVAALADALAAERGRAQLLRDQVGTLTAQLDQHVRLKRDADCRSSTADQRCSSAAARVVQLEQQLADEVVARDRLHHEKQRYLKFMEQLSCSLQMERMSHDVGFDMLAEAALSRAVQLVKLEADSLADKSSRLHGLQRKLKTMREQLESKDLHLELLRRKIGQLEERIGGQSELERDRDGHQVRSTRLAKRLQHVEQQLHDCRIENTELRARLLSSADLKLQTVEQQKEIEQMAVEIARLEALKSQHQVKISTLKSSMSKHRSLFDDKKNVSDETISQLSKQLATTKRALDDCTKRERQLLDLRLVVSRMLGLNVDTLAVPDYEIVRRLESLVRAHRRATSGAFAAADDLDAVVTLADQRDCDLLVDRRPPIVPVPVPLPLMSPVAPLGPLAPVAPVAPLPTALATSFAPVYSDLY